MPHVQVQWLLGATFFILMICFLGIAYCTTMVHLLIVMLLNGICYGSLLNCGNMFTLHLWGSEVGPFMQAVHFAFGLGAFFAPLIVEPFLIPLVQLKHLAVNQTSSSNVVIGQLANISETIDNSHVSSGTSYSRLMANVDIDREIDLSSLSRDQLRLHSAFYIMTAINATVFLLYLGVTLKYSDNPMHPTRQASMDRKTAMQKKSLESKSNVHQSAESATTAAGTVAVGVSCPPWMRYILVTLSGIFIHAGKKLFSWPVDR